LGKKKEEHFSCPYCGAENPLDSNSCRNLECGRRVGHYKASSIYIFGIILWIAIWLFIVIPTFEYGAISFITSKLGWVSLIPFIMGIISMLINAIIWRKKRCFGDYETEVIVIEIVEGHVRPLVLAISVVILIATNLNVMPPAFIGYTISALVCAFCGVLPLYWIPCDTVEALVKLRHLKTIPFFYAIFFFSAGLLSLITAIFT